MLRTCVFTVFTETDSSPAISGLDRFVGRYRSTLSSLGLSSSVRAEGGTWAVKERFEPKSEAESREEAEIQGIAREAGIPVPGVIRSADGDVSLVVGDVRICVFEWVDVLERDVWHRVTPGGRWRGRRRPSRACG